MKVCMLEIRHEVLEHHKFCGECGSQTRVLNCEFCGAICMSPDKFCTSCVGRV